MEFYTKKSLREKIWETINSLAYKVSPLVLAMSVAAGGYSTFLAFPETWFVTKIWEAQSKSLRGKE